MIIIHTIKKVSQLITNTVNRFGLHSTHTLCGIMLHVFTLYTSKVNIVYLTPVRMEGKLQSLFDLDSNMGCHPSVNYAQPAHH